MQTPTEMDAVLALRVKNLRAIIAQRSATAVARDIGLANTSYLSHLTHGHRAITEKAARKIEKGLKLAQGWLDREHDGLASSRLKLDESMLIRIQSAIDAAPGARTLTAQQRAKIMALVYERGRVESDYVESLVSLTQNQ